jgi:hypothetical protein
VFTAVDASEKGNRIIPENKDKNYQEQAGDPEFAQENVISSPTIHMVHDGSCSTWHRWLVGKASRKLHIFRAIAPHISHVLHTQQNHFLGSIFTNKTHKKPLRQMSAT